MEIKIEKLEWITYKPEFFPCGVCHKENAEYRATIKDRALEVRIPICVKCSVLPPKEILRRAAPKED